MYAIEKGVPMPLDDGLNDARRAKVYNFHSLEIGDSILIPEQNKSGSAWAAAYNYNLRNKDRELTGRTLPEGLRIWRTK